MKISFGETNRPAVDPFETLSLVLKANNSDFFGVFAGDFVKTRDGKEQIFVRIARELFDENVLLRERAARRRVRREVRLELFGRQPLPQLRQQPQRLLTSLSVGGGLGNGHCCCCRMINRGTLLLVIIATNLLLLLLLLLGHESGAEFPHHSRDWGLGNIQRAQRSGRNGERGKSRTAVPSLLLLLLLLLRL